MKRNKKDCADAKELSLDEFKRLYMESYGVSLRAESMEDAMSEAEQNDSRNIREDSTRKFSPKSLNEDSRSVDVVVATETPVLRWSWKAGVFDECFDMNGVNLERTEIPFIQDHNSDTIDSVLGTTKNLHVEDGQLVGTRFFSSTAAKAWELMKEGHLSRQSIGYSIDEAYMVKAGEETEINGRKWKACKERDLRVVTKWTPLEDSAVVIPADKNTGARSASQVEDSAPSAAGIDAGEEGESKQSACAKAGKGERKMADENKVTNSAADENAQREQLNAAIEMRNREVAEICELCERHGCNAISADAIKNNKSVADVRAMILDELAKRSAAVVTPAASAVEVTADAADKRNAAVRDAILSDNGMKPAKMAEGANDFRGMTAKDIVALYAGQDAQRTYDSEKLFKRAMATGDFPVLLQSTTEYSLMQGLDDADENYGEWCDLSGSVRDFREEKVARGIRNFSLDQVGEGEEYSYVNMGEDSDSVKVLKYGRKAPITWEAVINDKLGETLTKFPYEWGRAAKELEADMAYDILISNPNAKDGTALFSSGHKNLAAAGAAPSEASLAAAIRAISTQKDSGKPVRIKPVFWIGPHALDTTILKLLKSTSLTDGNAASTQFNTVFGSLRPIFESRLDAAFDGNNYAWFVLGSPRYTVKFYHLSGHETPEIFLYEDKDIDGYVSKCRFVTAAHAGFWQGFYKNPGTTI